MDSTIPKPWLTPEQQVEHLKGEGVKFEIVQGSDAVTYLRNNNNFFRINQFKKGFPRYSGGKNDGKFINLDFAMLKAVSYTHLTLLTTWLLLIMSFVRFFSR